MKNIESDAVAKKSIYRSLYVGILCMFMLLVCLSTMTWAFFSSSVSTKTSSVKAASFDVKLYQMNDEAGKEIMDNVVTITNGEQHKFRFVKQGLATGHFSATVTTSDNVTNDINGVFEKNVDESYFELVIDSNATETNPVKVKLNTESIGWGKGNNPTSTNLDKEKEKPVILMAVANPTSEPIEFVEGDPLVLTLGSSTLKYNSNASRLPEGYQEIKYIEANGNHYIDLGIEPSDRLSFKINADSISSNLIGCKKTHIETEEAIVDYYYCLNEDGSGLKQPEEYDYVDELNNLYLFGINENNKCTNNYIGKLYSLNIYSDNNLIKELIPCIKDDVVGMYDLNNNEFLPLNGEYSGGVEKVLFVCGHVVDYIDVQPIEDQTLQYNVKDCYEISTEVYNIPGLEFKGWSLTPDGEVIEPNEEGKYHFVTENGGATILYAAWQPTEYSITYNLDKDDATLSCEPTLKFTMFDEVALVVPNELEEFAFDRYVDEDGNPIIKIEKGTKHDVTIYATWSEHTVEIIEEKEEIEESTENIEGIEEEIENNIE